MHDAEWFKRRMRALRVTQEQVGRVLNCDRSVVSRIVNGKQELALSQVLPLADILQVGPFEVLKRTNFWDARRRNDAEWLALYEEIDPEERERIADAVRALSRRK